MTWKQLSSHKLLQILFSNKCFIICDILLVTKCSLILDARWRLFSPMYQDWHPAHVNLQTTIDLSALHNLSLDENKEPILNGVQTILIWILHNLPIFFLVLTEISPMYGNLWYVLFSLLEFSLGVSYSDILLFKNNFRVSSELGDSVGRTFDNFQVNKKRANYLNHHVLCKLWFFQLDLDFSHVFISVY